MSSNATATGVAAERILQRIGVLSVIECQTCGDPIFDLEPCYRCARLAEFYDQLHRQAMQKKLEAAVELVSSKPAAGSPGALYRQKHGASLWDRLPAREHLGTVRMRTRMLRAAERLNPFRLDFPEWVLGVMAAGIAVDVIAMWITEQ